MSPQEPESVQSAGKPKAEVRFGIVKTPIQGCPQVVMLYLNALQPKGLVSAVQLRRIFLHQRHEVVAMSTPNRPVGPTFQESLFCVLPHGFQQPTTRNACALLSHHQALIAERRQKIEQFTVARAIVGADLFGGRQCPTSREYGQVLQRQLLLFLE
jgi:hypothetical protein